MTDDLKPCPFCGGDAIFEKHTGCSIIRCMSRSRGCHMRVTKDRATTSSLKEVWNRRADLVRPKVKPLVWDSYEKVFPDGSGARLCSADGCFGYKAEIFRTPDDRITWHTSSGAEGPASSIEDAVSAVWGDYERRILSALEGE